MYIQADRVLTKNDIFLFYQLSSVGKPSNQEIEIFQLFSDEPLETGTVGWVAMGNMANNVFVPYYPMLLTEIYPGYQVSTRSVPWIPVSQGRPSGLCTYLSDSSTGEAYYISYPKNWRDSYYFTFEGLSGYILSAQAVDGRPVSQADQTYIREQLYALQQEFIAEFAAMDPQDTSRAGASMAQRAHQLALALLDWITTK